LQCLLANNNYIQFNGSVLIMNSVIVEI